MLFSINTRCAHESGDECVCVCKGGGVKERVEVCGVCTMHGGLCGMCTWTCGGVRGVCGENYVCCCFMS